MTSINRKEKDRDSTSSRVTVIVTTSPMISDPEPDILEKVLSSLSYAGLSQCRIILVMDYFVAGEPRKRRLCGRISADRVAAYEERSAAVIESARNGSFGHSLKQLEVLRLKSWHGFALAVKRALQEVRTSLVCVVQHDLVFRRKIHIVPLLNVIQEKNNGVNYIYFKRDAQKNYREKAKSLHRLELGPPKSFGAMMDTSLIRLPRYFDGTHVACTEWYRNFLYGTNFKPGQFIDQSIGKQMLHRAMEKTESIIVDGDELSIGVHDVCATFGCWMWYNEEDPLIEHLNGRTHLGKSELMLRVRQSSIQNSN